MPFASGSMHRTAEIAARGASCSRRSVARDTHVGAVSTTLFAGFLAMKLVVKAAVAAIVVIALEQV
jgi:hypothetical protein